MATEEYSEPSIWDIDCPEWATTTKEGIWCNVCGELLVASFHVEEDTTVPDNCKTCGAPDDLEAMAEFFDDDEEE